MQTRTKVAEQPKQQPQTQPLKQSEQHNTPASIIGTETTCKTNTSGTRQTTRINTSTTAKEPEEEKGLILCCYEAEEGQHKSYK